MKIDESFRDLKSLLQLDHVMNLHQAQMEKVVALVLLAFAIGYLVGEELRESLYGKPLDSVALPPATPSRSSSAKPPHPKRACYSGLFILIKFDRALTVSELKPAVSRARANFVAVVRGNIRTFVRGFVRTSVCSY